MYSKTFTGKAFKGSVQIITSHAQLQLRFRFAGKRHYLSLGFPDTTTNRKLPEKKAREIELDILSGNFDQTLQKYKTQSALSVASPDIASDKVIHKEIVKKVKRGVPQCPIERVLGKSVDELEAVKCLVESGWLPSSILKETTESLDEVCDHIRAAFAQPEEPQNYYSICFS